MPQGITLGAEHVCNQDLAERRSDGVQHQSDPHGAAPEAEQEERDAFS